MIDTAPLARPADASELGEVFAEATATGQALELRSGGSKREIGRLRETQVIDLGVLAGVVDYQPSELVLSVRPATPLKEIEDLLAAHGQILAFEPWDHGVLFGRARGEATIGGIVAAGVAGSRRVSAGGARDHLLGFSAVSGRAESFKGGGKVVKNVTGYDLSKVIAGSWGQLAAMTELTLKVLPAPRAQITLALDGLSAPTAVAVMAKAMGSPCAPAAAAHLPARASATAVTLIRLEGFRESVEQRVQQLIGTLAEFGSARPLAPKVAERAWLAVREAGALEAGDALWRAHVPPSRMPTFTASIEAAGGEWCCDWAGSLVWAGAPAGVDLDGLARQHAGHARLIRGTAPAPQTSPAGQDGVAALAGRLKRAFDPAGILDPRRFT